MTVAERLTARGLKTIVLPSSGESVIIRRPKTIDLMRIGLFPLTVSRMNLESIPPDEREAIMKEADRSAVRMICECTVEPRIVNRTAKPGEVRIDAMDADDFAFLHEQILEFAVSDKPEKPTENFPGYETNLEVLAKSCSHFGIDPTRAELWEPERAERLIMFAGLAVKRNGN